jgi:protein gp37
MNTIKIEKLKPHPLNASIYGDSSNQELEQSISKKGILSPLLVTKESALISGCHTIVSGHRRYYAAQKLGLQELPVLFFESTDQLDIQEALIEGNRQRAKTNEQLAREAQALIEIEKKRGQDLMRECGKNGGNTAGKGRPKVDRGSPNLANPYPESTRQETTSQKHDSRTVVAKKLETSNGNLSKTLAVVETIDKLTERGETEQAEEIRTVLNKKSVNAAYQIAKPVIQEEKKEKEMELKIKKTKGSGFNYTNENVDWAKWTWNPMTGCKHGCPYCYARDIAMRFTGHFHPELHEDRLNDPVITRIPKGKENELGITKVFVGSMTDLFGEWFTDEQIQKVLDACQATPQWEYLFLTKNPKRYKTIQFPVNCWVGATADTQARCDAAMEAFSSMPFQPTIRFLSCEPLLEKIVLPAKPPVDWVIIGAQTRTSQCPELQPNWEWFFSLYSQCERFQIPAYCKPNLAIQLPNTPKEWPASK